MTKTETGIVFYYSEPALAHKFIIKKNEKVQDVVKFKLSPSEYEVSIVPNPNSKNATIEQLSRLNGGAMPLVLVTRRESPISNLITERKIATSTEQNKRSDEHNLLGEMNKKECELEELKEKLARISKELEKKTEEIKELKERVDKKDGELEKKDIELEECRGKLAEWQKLKAPAHLYASLESHLMENLRISQESESVGKSIE
ncbi:hypothetical protein ROZALSC1DRAFT_29932 [Rozella allomycis CSF55]|uniref:Uncharacterized protein n=1 Tax=Rozella allomycis (strain CSF55) TaxID=988480 RepID=A0A075AWG3_ROZAC|nr:hypothetical protein O9G_002817 [Rozella allomycis CSF55]RKP18374.1 hypothetical protein ROZALSC1DRAFT_29932 [Rozella allomycis CSF55]|eukprot:EPZ32899.1 hypothetical protein O9G_002817 [Rozella allomycis CSF55]